ncbi:gamma-glutamyltransferase family protein [Aquibaculum arenosum]|uniref:Gamma-glutamyltransferase n=1 Tax=Aquibaculum arenosum TaxID=3032591 RepID=A0ABT5YR48_9PROT|nr:gamma-glutamyltransferase [Fodinicurvata sp. CAU 1616]MDF2097456.1 gamma-glutamyltransferase [Fodinicurvata sp. CAU 1616]
MENAMRGAMRRGAVATANPDGARAGLEVLEAGGNAIDAAVAAAFAMGVVEPLDNGIGASGFALVHSASEGRTVAVDFLGTAPKAAQFELTPAFTGFMTGYHLLVRDRANEIGHRSVAVPGAVRGLAHLVERFGSLPFRDVVEPAARLAEAGFTMDRYLAERIATTRDYIERYPETARLFLDAEGNPLPAGAKLRLTDLAGSLRRLQEAGPDDLYEGDLAAAILAEIQRGGGFMTAEDLAAFRPVERQPVTGRYLDYEVATMPPPSSGAFVLAGLAHLQRGAAKDHHLALGTAMQRMFALRASTLGDPAQTPVDLSSLGIDNESLRLREPPQTTSLSTMDAAGNAVTITYSNMNHSGVVVPGTGIVLNNQLLLFNPWPGTPNSLSGGRKPVSSMMPTLLFDAAGQAAVAIGGSGSTRIPTSLMQVLYHRFVRGLPLAEALTEPRLHAEGTQVTADAELAEVAEQVAAELGCSLELLPGRDSKLGIVQCISRDADGSVEAIGDPRADGQGLVL